MYRGKIGFVSIFCKEGGHLLLKRVVVPSKSNSNILLEMSRNDT